MRVTIDVTGEIPDALRRLFDDQERRRKASATPRSYWVINATPNGLRPYWRDRNGTDWAVTELVNTASPDDYEQALVDLAELIRSAG